MSEWRDISTAPKDCLVLVWDADTGHAEVVRWNAGVDAWLIGFPDGNADAGDDVVGWTAYDPTHWMSLPSPPDAKPTDYPPQVQPHKQQ